MGNGKLAVVVELPSRAVTIINGYEEWGMVPSALRITGQDLDDWSSTPGADATLPVLVRRLLSAQLPRGGRVQFRGDTGVRFAGYDGVTDFAEPVLDAPAGPAVWELSVNAKPGSKADGDYAKRTREPGEVSPGATAYVALTARHWPAKEAWAQKKRAEGHWREVRALDADDLARWLECSPAVAAWFSGLELGRPVDQLADPRALLVAWGELTAPPLPASVLLAGREEEGARLRAWAQWTPTVLPVRGESHEEALHFAAAALAEGTTDENFEARVVVARSTEALEWLLAARTPQPLIILAAFPDVEDRAVSARAHHLLIAHGRGERLMRNYVDLPPLERTALAAALESVLDPGAAYREAWASGGSVGALQRALGRSAPADWASGPLAPERRAMLLAGAWNPDMPGDRTLIERLSGRTADEVDAACASLAVAGALRRKNGAWVWRSANDAWGLLAGQLTIAQLGGLADVSVEALGEEDPEAGAGLEKRLLLAVKGERRHHSASLRSGLAGSLALLATSPHQYMLVGPVQRRNLVAGVVRRVLTAPWQRWAALASELPTLAEAAPDAFLDAVEASLAKGSDGVAGLFAVEQGGLGPSPHVQLLWALETLGWEPARLRRVAHALARLAALDPGGQMANRPKRSLQALLNPLWPQTLADAPERLAVLESLWSAAQSVAWKAGLDLMPTPLSRWRVAAHRPAFLPGPPPPRPPESPQIDVAMVAGVRDFILSHAGEEPERWADILKLVSSWPVEVRAPVLETMLKRAPTIRDRDEAGHVWGAAREHLVRVLRNAKNGGRTSADEEVRARRAYQSLEPEDPVRRIAWLFAPNPHAPEAAELEWREESACHTQLRRAALQQFLVRADFVQLLPHLMCEVPSPDVLGFALGELGHGGLEELILGPTLEKGPQRGDLVRGFIVAKHNFAGSSWLAHVLKDLVRHGRLDEAARAAAALIPGRVLWDVLDGVGGGLAKAYWGLGPSLYGSSLTADERLRAVRRLLEAGRPASALEALSKWESKHDASPPSQLVLEVLETSMGTSDTLRGLGDGGSVGYHISHVLGLLGELEGADLERAIRVEVFFLPVLDDFGGAPRLFRALAETPALFAGVVAMAWAKDDANLEEDSRRQRRRVGHHILQEWGGAPGENAASAEERDSAVENWCRDVAEELSAKQLRDSGWSELARVLARVSSADGVWPCSAARRLLEEGVHPDLGSYLHTAKRNLRGVFTKGLTDGGRQERGLAERFRQDESVLRTQGFLRAAALAHALAESYERDAEREDTHTAELLDP